MLPKRVTETAPDAVELTEFISFPLEEVRSRFRAYLIENIGKQKNLDKACKETFLMATVFIVSPRFRFVVPPSYAAHRAPSTNISGYRIFLSHFQAPGKFFVIFLYACCTTTYQTHKKVHKPTASDLCTI